MTGSLSPSGQAAVPQESFPSCRLCGQLWRGAPLKLGHLPVCNRFTAIAVPPDLHDLALDQCGACGLVQLRTLPSIPSVVPTLPWISYREPDGHLDSVAANLVGRFPSQVVSAFGFGPFEKPLFDRLAAHGVQTELVDVRPRDSIAGSYPYLETWQRGLTHAGLNQIAKKHGRADIVTCRYLIEHCHDPVAALRGLGGFLRPDGLLLVELPDSSKFLATKDYCFLWEEHVSYFTEPTLRQLAAKAGFQLVELMRFEGRLEDAFVMLLRPASEELPIAAADASEQQVFVRYRAGYEQARASVSSMFGPPRSREDRVALFGLGHQAIMFTNAMGISSSIAAAVDDDVNKRGLFAPGFSVPVTTSAELAGNCQIQICLLAVNPGVEHKIKEEKLAPLVARGVKFHSIFAGVPGSILLDLPPWR
ncbi:methyltransferase domain-containing protein [Tardiphaga sp. 619_E2_N8_5]|uniref:class I SAM-dependent methyltransferase n=1 Tax=unclassified Tardiphaga TaxID=2631404 RepID=UPI003F240168